MSGGCKGERNYLKKKNAEGRGAGSWEVLVVLKDVWVAGVLRGLMGEGGGEGGDPTSVPVRVTLINHILSAGCVED